jgi:hypothetical protein
MLNPSPSQVGQRFLVRLEVDTNVNHCHRFLTLVEEQILDGVLREFQEAMVQYVCVSSEVSTVRAAPHVHVQIILKRAVNKTKWFLDACTGISRRST